VKVSIIKFQQVMII